MYISLFVEFLLPQQAQRKKMMTECRGGGDPYSYSPPACIIFKDMWSKMIQEKLKEVKKNTLYMCQIIY